MRASSQRRVAVGFFDGVHLGHRAVLKTADAAVTFTGHPLSVIAPHKAPKLIMSTKERLDAIREIGVGEITAVDFTPELAEMSCEEFALTYLGRPGEAVILSGADWRFGRGAQGSGEWLAAHGYDVETSSYMIWEGERISSSRIRASLRNGDVASAAKMLSRPYRLDGITFNGKGKGRSIGFPTVNFSVSHAKEPIIPLGVYSASICGQRALVNFGTAPTFAADAWETPVIEAHFLGDVPVIADDSVAIDFLGFIRRECRFSSVEELRSRIAADKALCLNQEV